MLLIYREQQQLTVVGTILRLINVKGCGRLMEWVLPGQNSVTITFLSDVVEGTPTTVSIFLPAFVRACSLEESNRTKLRTIDPCSPKCNASSKNHVCFEQSFPLSPRCSWCWWCYCCWLMSSWCFAHTNNISASSHRAHCFHIPP